MLRFPALDLSITHKSVDGFAKPSANDEKPGFATAGPGPLERISTGQTCQTRRTLAKDLWVMDSALDED